MGWWCLMQEVRTTQGVPTVADFALDGGSTAGAPLVVDGLTGDVYALAASDTVVCIGGPVGSGTVAPSTTPHRIGQFYVDTVADKLYFSTGTASSADWIAAN